MRWNFTQSVWQFFTDKKLEHQWYDGSWHNKSKLFIINVELVIFFVKEYRVSLCRKPVIWGSFIWFNYHKLFNPVDKEINSVGIFNPELWNKH